MVITTRPSASCALSKAAPGKLHARIRQQRSFSAEQVRDVAAELLDIYARRAARKGYAFADPSVDYATFSAGFPFEETPDQQSAIEAVGIENYESAFFNRHGQFIYSELRGRHAGYPQPEVSIHRGKLHKILFDAAVQRLGAHRVHTGHRFVGITHSDEHVSIHFQDPQGQALPPVQSQVLIAADESIRKASDPIEVARRNAADIVMLKVQPLGGIERSFEIANQSGLRAVVSSALETSIGLSQGAFLAAALPELEFDCGLGTLSLMESDISSEPLRPVAGRITPREIEPDAALLEKYQASGERTQWWLARLERCFNLLEA